MTGAAASYQASGMRIRGALSRTWYVFGSVPLWPWLLRRGRDTSGVDEKKQRIGMMCGVEIVLETQTVESELVSSTSLPFLANRPSI